VKKRHEKCEGHTSCSHVEKYDGQSQEADELNY